MRLATSSIPLSRSIAASLMLCCAQPCQSTFATMGNRPHKSGFQKCSSVMNSLACRNANRALPVLCTFCRPPSAPATLPEKIQGLRHPWLHTRPNCFPLIAWWFSIVMGQFTRGYFQIWWCIIMFPIKWPVSWYPKRSDTKLYQCMATSTSFIVGQPLFIYIYFIIYVCIYIYQVSYIYIYISILLYNITFCLFYSISVVIVLYYIILDYIILYIILYYILYYIIYYIIYYILYIVYYILYVIYYILYDILYIIYYI